MLTVATESWFFGQTTRENYSFVVSAFIETFGAGECGGPEYSLFHGVLLAASFRSALAAELLEEEQTQRVVDFNGAPYAGVGNDGLPSFVGVGLLGEILVAFPPDIVEQDN